MKNKLARGCVPATARENNDAVLEERVGVIYRPMTKELLHAFRRDVEFCVLLYRFYVHGALSLGLDDSDLFR